MNIRIVTAVTLVVAAMSANCALADATRDKVLAELADAQRNGEIVTGDAGPKLNEVFPGRYPAKPAVQGKTREQVLAELAEAQRNGDITTGDGGPKLNQLFPGRYPLHAANAK